MINFCANCGQKVDKKTGLCPQCDQANLKAKKKRKKLVRTVIVVVCCIGIIATSIFGALIFLNKVTVPYTYGEYNSFMEGFTDVIITDEKSAIEAVASVSDALGIQNAESELKVSFTNKRETETYYRIQQYYNGIPVFGRNITVVAGKEGNALGLTSNYSPVGDIDITPSLNEEKISNKIDKEYDGVDSQTNNGLVIYSLYNSSSTLAYDITVSKSDENNVIHDQCIISAKNGDILLKNNLIRTGNIKHSSDEYTYKINDKTYLMYDESRNILVLNSNKKKLVAYGSNNKCTKVSNDNKTNENPNPLWEKNKTLICGNIKLEGSKDAKWNESATNLINSVENIYDFYSKILKWNGYDNKNSPMLTSYNDYHYSDGDNAYSSANVLVFGYQQDLSNVGQVGHEFTHSVEGSISNMIYSGETGSIMEAYSDIFGEIAEDYAKDGVLNGKCTWTVFDRNIKSPSDNNQPARYLDENWGSTVDNGDNNDCGHVHKNSTVISHAAYLMSEGIDKNPKIDNASLASMWFNALNLLQPDSNFSQCRNAVELSARIMLKNKKLTEEQYKTVIAAFEKVGINNAVFTYSETVKNKFDLSVITYVDSGVVNASNEVIEYKLEIVNLNNIKAKKVFEKEKISGQHTLNLKDGTYVLRITDINDSENISKSIDVKIVVDGDDSKAKDKITIKTDFTPVVLNEDSSNKANESKDKINDLKSSIIDKYGLSSQESFTSCLGADIQSYPNKIFGIISMVDNIDLDKDNINDLIVLRVSKSESNQHGDITVETYKSSNDYSSSISTVICEVSFCTAKNIYLYYSDIIGKYSIVIDSYSSGSYTGVDSWSANVFTLSKNSIDAYANWEYVPRFVTDVDFETEFKKINLPYAKYCTTWDTRNNNTYFQPLCEIEHEIYGDTYTYMTRNHKLKIKNTSSQ